MYLAGVNIRTGKGQELCTITIIQTKMQHRRIIVRYRRRTRSHRARGRMIKAPRAEAADRSIRMVTADTAVTIIIGIRIMIMLTDGIRHTTLTAVTSQDITQARTVRAI